MIYLQLFLSFLQIGMFSIGGGYAAMPLIQDQVVSGHGWLTMSEFTDHHRRDDTGSHCSQFSYLRRYPYCRDPRCFGGDFRMYSSFLLYRVFPRFYLLPV